MGSSAPSLATPTPQPTITSTPPPQPILPPYEYTFPQDKLNRRLNDTNKTPLVLVACGSFSPITTLHLQLFELAKRYVDRTNFEIVGNYMSPCSDTYGKSSLVAAHHRINMCSLAIQERESNIMIDEWETLRRDSAGNPLYTCTVDVLRRLDEQLNDVLGGIEALDGTFVRARVMLLIGADLALTMGDTKVWEPADIDVLLGYYGAFIVERPTQCDIQQAIEPLKKYHDKIWVIPSFQNDVSSTKARAQIQNGESALDLPKSVLQYIGLHHLYQKLPLKDAPSLMDRPSKDTYGMADRDMVSPHLPIASHPLSSRREVAGQLQGL